MKRLFIVFMSLMFIMCLVGCETHTHSYTLKYDEKEHYSVCLCGDKKEINIHNFMWVIDCNPTQESIGLKHQECNICHYKINDNTIIPKLINGFSYYNDEHIKGDFYMGYETDTSVFNNGDIKIKLYLCYQYASNKEPLNGKLDINLCYNYEQSTSKVLKSINSVEQYAVDFYGKYQDFPTTEAIREELISVSPIELVINDELKGEGEICLSMCIESVETEGVNQIKWSTTWHTIYYCVDSNTNSVYLSIISIDDAIELMNNSNSNQKGER